MQQNSKISLKKHKFNFERVVELRRYAGLSQSKVAAILGTSQRNYSHMECGDINIPCLYLIKLATLFNTSIDYLLGLTDVKKPYSRSKSFDITKNYEDD